MKFRAFVLILLFLILIPITLTAGDKNGTITSGLADSVLKVALTELTGYKLLGEICKIGPRLSGSKQSIEAIKFTKKYMEQMGFDSVWLQKTMVPHWVRGKIEKCEMVIKGQKKRSLRIAALGGSVGTPIKGISAEVIEISSYEELARRSTEVKGKIVFYNVLFDQSMVNTFAGYGKAVQFRSTGAIEAAKLGAVGMILRSITTRNDNTPHVGMMRSDTSVTKIPSAAIGVQDADILSESLHKNKIVKLNLKLDCVTKDDVESDNLICEIKGIKYPNEVIVVGGHFDSWDQGDGAHDDAAGCVQSLEALLITKRLGIQPARTLRCIFYMNEENGVRGAITYGEYAKNSPEVHYAAIESDRGAFTPRGFSIDADSATIAAMQRWIPLMNKSGIEWIRYGGSGVDISFIKNAKARIGYVPDDQRYFDYHHSANDIYSEINPREFELGSASITLLMLLLSEEGF